MLLDREAYRLHLATFRAELHPRDLLGRFQEKLDKLSVNADKRGVEVWVTARKTGPKDHEVGAVLEHIQTMPGAKGKGRASEVLDEVHQVADEFGAPVALNVGDPDFIQKHEGALSKPKLTAWYKRHGYVPNKGRNKDYAFTHAMIRKPDPEKKKTPDVSAPDNPRFKKVLTNLNKAREGAKEEILERGEVPDAAEAARMQEYVDAGTVSIRTTPTALEAVLRDKKFKTFHEAGTTLGEPDPGKKEYELRLWGDHPIYGYVAPGDERGSAPYDAGVGMYGPVKVELRDKVKHRATVTPNDSWMAGGFPSPATNIDALTMADTPGSHGGRTYGEAHGPYVEAQIFGGVKPADIERVVFGAGQPSDKLKRLLDEAKIKWSIDPNWRENRAEFEDEYWEPDEIDTDRYR